MAHESFRFLLDKCGCGFGLWQSKSHLSSGAYKICFSKANGCALKPGAVSSLWVGTIYFRV
ncbi:hypothetical protein Hdeb2414_s0034g00726961 [Helianthus debilis subsp. tardiflorus]